MIERNFIENEKKLINRHTITKVNEIDSNRTLPMIVSRDKQTLFGYFNFSSTILCMFYTSNSKIGETRGIFLQKRKKQQSTRKYWHFFLRRTCCISRILGPLPSSRSLSVSLVVAKRNNEKFFVRFSIEEQRNLSS